MKVIAPTLVAHRAAKAAKVYSGQPRPVDTNGATPHLWASCVGYEIDDPAATVDTQDLVSAIAAAPGKVRPQDDTPAKVKARLAAEVAKAKADREAGVKPGRPVGEIKKQRGGGR